MTRLSKDILNEFLGNLVSCNTKTKWISNHIQSEVTEFGCEVIFHCTEYCS